MLQHPKRTRFQRWLYEGDLAATALWLGVTKTTIRAWRTGRSYPHPLRYQSLILAALSDGLTLRPSDLRRPRA
jgi:hypothetical protein